MPKCVPELASIAAAASALKSSLYGAPATPGAAAGSCEQGSGTSIRCPGAASGSATLSSSVPSDLAPSAPSAGCSSAGVRAAVTAEADLDVHVGSAHPALPPAEPPRRSSLSSARSVATQPFRLKFLDCSVEEL